MAVDLYVASGNKKMVVPETVFVFFVLQDQLNTARNSFNLMLGYFSSFQKASLALLTDDTTILNYLQAMRNSNTTLEPFLLKLCMTVTRQGRK